MENLKWNLKISEIMYHPSPPTPAEAAKGFIENDFEFIELHNQSNQPMDLAGIYLTGIDFDFPSSGALVLAPDQYAVIAAHPHAFAARYGTHIPLAGWTMHPFRSGRLSDGGEDLELHAADGSGLSWVLYDDKPFETDGYGKSLELLRPFLSQGFRVSASRFDNGSPGAAAVASPDLDLSGWMRLSFTPEQMNSAAITGASADPDGDGLTNLQEYIFGTSPVVQDAKDQLSMVREWTPDGPRNILTFPWNLRANSGLITVETSARVDSGWRDLLILPLPRIQYSQIGNIFSPDRKKVLGIIDLKATAQLPTDRFYRLRMHQ